jgi:hypothetical protein
VEHVTWPSPPVFKPISLYVLTTDLISFASIMASVTQVVPSPSEIGKWYSQVSSRFVDLISDYAGKEIFLIEGDSLLLECFSDPRIDFDGA